MQKNLRKKTCQKSEREKKMNSLSTEILLERHGESLGNKARVFLGHTDLDLSEEGYRQADVCANHFCGERIDAIYSSDLLRAYNTALAHARIRKMNIVAKRGLREIYGGEWENMPFAEIKEKYPHEYCRVWREQFASFNCVGAEPVPKLAERIHASLLEIAKENPGGRVLVVTHAAAIRAFFGKIYGYSEKEASEKLVFPTNVSVSRVLYDGEKFIPVSYSEDGYISEANAYRNA